jgi:peptide/nickel transport system permease protein
LRLRISKKGRMSAKRSCALVIIVVAMTTACLAVFLAPSHYSQQFREFPNANPSWRFPLGTDELGRDRFSRLLYGSQVSLVLAPSAAALSTILAALIGGLAGFLGGFWERLAMAVTDLFLSLPWLFLLITVRAVLPLNASPETSVIITFVLLGLLGWASSARVVCAGMKSLQASDFVLQAKAMGYAPMRLFLVQLLPNVRPLLLAQFTVSIPVFILAEANLGILGLGVNEPLPSWGSLLRELENLSALSAQPWRLAPLVLLVILVGSFQLVLSERKR